MWVIVSSIMIILVFHFIADFYFQSTKMAVGKGKDVGILLSHVGVYGLWLIASGYVIYCIVGSEPWGVVLWIISNTMFHGVTDYFTSRANARITAKEGMGHNFFVMIGFDQLIHFLTLIFTAAILLF